MNGQLQLVKPNSSSDPVATGWLQRKHTHAQTSAGLSIGPVNDPYEQEADRIADSVLQTPVRSIQSSHKRFDFSSVPVHRVSRVPSSQGIIMRQATTTSQRVNLFPPSLGNLVGPPGLPAPQMLPKSGGNDCAAHTPNILSQQPASLQTVVRHSDPDRVGSNPDAWFASLGAMQHVLITIFSRLCQLGIWQRVTKVRFVTPGGKPLGPFEVPGYTGTAALVADDRNALMADLLGSFRFCSDIPIASAFHKGQASFREVSGSDSMHVSVGPGNNFDVHIDRYSSPKGGGGGTCEYDPIGSAAHLGREVLPGLIRSKTGIPGIQGFPEQIVPDLPGGTQRGEQAPPSIIGVRLNF